MYLRDGARVRTVAPLLLDNVRVAIRSNGGLLRVADITNLAIRGVVPAVTPTCIHTAHTNHNDTVKRAGAAARESLG